MLKEMNESYRYNIIENSACSISWAIKCYVMLDRGGGGVLFYKEHECILKPCTILKNFKLKNPKRLNL